VTPVYTPRRPYYDDEPDGYLESDLDYIVNNRALAVVLLDNHEAMLTALRAIAADVSPYPTLAARVASNAIPQEFK
jgi:hypothetical protein